MRIQAHEFICADPAGEIIVGTEESDPVLPRGQGQACDMRDRPGGGRVNGPGMFVLEVGTRRVPEKGRWERPDSSVELYPPISS